MQFSGKCVDYFLASNSVAHGKTAGTSEQDIDQDHLLLFIRPYYVNTSEIPSELSRVSMISSHVKITCSPLL